jgi:hypothetical protein
MRDAERPEERAGNRTEGCEKVVLMSLSDVAEFRSWPESPQHQDISKDREVGADSVVLLVKGSA